MFAVVVYKGFKSGVLTVKVAVVFCCRAMPCAGNLDVIAAVEAVFAVRFGKPGMQVSHALLRFEFVLASEYLL